MKKYLILFCLFIYKTNYSQNLFLFAEAQSTQPQKDYKLSNTPSNYYAWQWIGVTNKKGSGSYIQFSQEPDVKTLSIGYVKSFEFTHNRSIEFGIGPGLEWESDKHPTNFSGSGYLYYESKTDKDRSKGKFVMISNFYYSKLFGMWTQSSALYSINKFVAVGVYIQSQGSMGPRLQLNLPKGFSLWGVYDLEDKKSPDRIATLGLSWQRSIRL